MNNLALTYLQHANYFLPGRINANKCRRQASIVPITGGSVGGRLEGLTA